jgi:hypothetical protein
MCICRETHRKRELRAPRQALCISGRRCIALCRAHRVAVAVPPDKFAVARVHVLDFNEILSKINCKDM